MGKERIGKVLERLLEKMDETRGKGLNNRKTENAFLAQMADAFIRYGSEFCEKYEMKYYEIGRKYKNG